MRGQIYALNWQKQAVDSRVVVYLWRPADVKKVKSTTSAGATKRPLSKGSANPTDT